MDKQKEDFLPLFKINEMPWKSKAKAYTKCFFQIAFDDKGAYVMVVDDKGNEIFPDYRQYSGHELATLQSLERIKDEMSMDISWDDEPERIYLHDHPYLLYELLHCINLVTQKGTAIVVSQDCATVRLSIDNDGKQLHTALKMAGGFGETVDFHLLSDTFVMVGNTIYPIQSLGSNYKMLSYFVSTIPLELQEQFFSVFFSYITNVALDYDDYEVEWSDSGVEARPTLIFEKVDADNALYLRLTYSVPGMDFDFLRRFSPQYIATVTPEHVVELRHIMYSSDGGDAEALSKKIMSYAPNAAARKEVYEEDGLFIIPQNVAGPFLLRSLPQLVHDYHLLGADKLKEYKVKAVQPSLKVSLGSGIDFLEGDADVTLGDETFSLASFLQQYKKQRYITLSDGDRAIIDDSYVRRLERIFHKGRGKNGFRVSFFDLPDVENLLNQRLEGAAFKRHRELFEGFDKLKDERLSLKQVNAKLRPYQMYGVKWMDYLYKNGMGGCLADDMGLGKTLQAISLLTLHAQDSKLPSLIVMPRSLLFNWQNELRRFAPQLSVYTYYSSDRDMTEAKKTDVVLTTYAMVRNDVEDFRKEDFNMVILDESQAIKNVGAQVTQAVCLLNAKHRFALSGTPVENNLTELYSLFRFLNPAMFGTLDEFNARYTVPIQKDNDKDTLRSLRAKIFPFMLRRLKKDVLKDLPDRIEQTIYVDMDSEQARFYEQRRSYFYDQVQRTIAAEGVNKSQFVMFQALSELRRIASVPESLSDGRLKSPKVEQLVENLSEAVGNGHKVVAFFNFIAGIELVGDRLDALGIDYVCMTGSTRDRQSLVDRFQNDKHCKVFLMTLKTGGVGLNLVAADTVFIVEPWWNKAAEEQAVNRLHRIGQKQKVLSYSMITRGTIEEKIQLLQQQKSELLAGLIGNDASSTKQLTEEDIRFILG